MRVVSCIFLMLISNVILATNLAPTETVMTQDIVRYINEYRKSRGLSALTLNSKISHEAKNHSEDMARHRVSFGHDGFQTRMDHLYSNIQHSRGGAENVAYNYKTAKIVVANWIKSPGHRQNIVGNYDLTGVGIARDVAGKIYYTQLFVRT